ncbi:MAG: ABC transporter ATP-binding protein, partial [Pseudomonadales bacterium]
AMQLLSRVGISEPQRRLREYPHELSGGMRQRVMIAMSLASTPDILIADEPTTALDVTIQAQILDLLRELQRDTGMAILFITHDLGVVAEMCREVAVMYAGRVVEEASVERLFSHPVHPYTHGLLNSITRLDTTPKGELNAIPGVVPALNEMPSGCRFRNRCEYARSRCAESPPELHDVAPGHRVACVRASEFV